MADGVGVTTFYGVENNILVKMAQHLPTNEQIANRAEGFQHTCMPVDMQWCGATTSVKLMPNHPHQPNRANEVVGVGVGNKQIGHLSGTHIGAFHLHKHTVAATTVGHKGVRTVGEGQAGGIAMIGQGVAGTEKN